MTERHTYVGRWHNVDVMVEEFVRDDGTRTLSAAFRPLLDAEPISVWGPPVRLEPTS